MVEAVEVVAVPELPTGVAAGSAGWQRGQRRRLWWQWLRKNAGDHFVQSGSLLIVAVLDTNR